MKASDLFVRSLEDGGVEYIFGIPGEENLDLLESLRKSKKIKLNKKSKFLAKYLQLLGPSFGAAKSDHP